MANHQKMKTLLLLFLVLPAGLFAQYDFEPSLEHPYGLPNPEAPKELLDFAPLIGECNCTSQTRNQDQSWAEPIEMKWRFKYILNGLGIQDETLKTDGKHSGSIRQFIPDSTKWYVHYYSSGAPSPTLPTWEGNKTEEGKIVLYRKQVAPNGMDGFYRLSFYDINDKGYKWIGEWVNLDESIVYPTWKIDCSNGKTANGTLEMRQAIVEASNRFSRAYIAKDLEGIMSSYTTDAKIFPNNRDILGGEELKGYWAPRNNGYETLHHKITSEAIKFFGNYAYDYGYYEGQSKAPDGTISTFKGKYVVVWKKEDDQWKMDLDIWNAIRD